jgi:hypothetical protein
MVAFEASSFAHYASRVDGVDPRLVLPSHHVIMRTFLAGIREEQGSHRYAPGKWSVREVVGHLGDVHLVFAYRMACFARGEEQSLPGFDEGRYVEGARHDLKPLPRLIAAWTALAASTEAQAAIIGDEAWDRPGIANGTRLTARQMLAALIGHEIHHLGVLKDRYGLG